ncbi:MAG: VPLPA-CTERM sorting domain-containing protein, partial [Paracoccaceae bacterium]
ASDSNLNGASFDLGTGLFTDPSVVLRFDLDADEDRRVDLDYNLIGSGNGRQDLFISVSALLFSAAGAGDYLVLYSQLGAEKCVKERGKETCEDGFGSHGTFEEFSVRPAGDLPPPPPPPPVPLPAAGWLMLAGLGGLAAMRRRKRA